MSDKLIEVATQIVEYVNNGDYMTALSYFESDVRNVINETESHSNTALLEIMRKQVELVDDEDWQQVLYNCETINELVNGQ
jgi:hypothetical protein